MDPALAPPPARPEPKRINSTGKVPVLGETEDKNGTVKTAAPAAHRGTRYKEKFQALREKYDQVTVTHEQAVKELAIAEEKLKRLQEECNLLLDAVDIAVPAQPSLIHYLGQDPVPPQYQSYTTVPGREPQQHASPRSLEEIREQYRRAASGGVAPPTVIIPDIGPLCAENDVPEDIRNMHHHFSQVQY